LRALLLKENFWGYVSLTLLVTIKNDNRVNPVRNSNGALNPTRIILKSNPAAAAGPEGLPPGHEPFRGGAWPGGPPAWRASGSERAAEYYF